MSEPVAEPYLYDRHRLPRGWSHPLKRSDVDAALDEETTAALGWVTLRWFERGPVSREEYARSIRWRGGGPVAPDDDWTPLLHISWPGRARPTSAELAWLPGGAALGVHPVPSDRRAAIRQLLVADGLPWALEWVRGIVRGAQTVRDEPADLIVSLDGDGRLARAEG